jgi:hypothetical protein
MSERVKKSKHSPKTVTFSFLALIDMGRVLYYLDTAVPLCYTGIETIVKRVKAALLFHCDTPSTGPRWLVMHQFFYTSHTY